MRIVGWFMLYLAGMVSHGDDNVAAVSLEGEPGYVFGLVSAIVVAGSVVGLLAVRGYHMGAQVHSGRASSLWVQLPTALNWSLPVDTRCPHSIS